MFTDFKIYKYFFRSKATALLYLFSRIGGACAPWIAQGLSHMHAVVPFIIMGGLTTVGGILCCVLKETRGHATKETTEDFQTTNNA